MPLFPLLGLRLGSAATSHDPIQQVRIDIIATGKLPDQKSGVFPPLVFGNSRFDEGVYEGAAKDIAIERRYRNTWLTHDATSHKGRKQNGNLRIHRPFTCGFNWIKRTFFTKQRGRVARLFGRARFGGRQTPKIRRSGRRGLRQCCFTSIASAIPNGTITSWSRLMRHMGIPKWMTNRTEHPACLTTFSFGAWLKRRISPKSRLASLSLLLGTIGRRLYERPIF